MKLFDLQLVRAELIKLRHAALVRGLFGIGIVGVFTVVLTYMLVDGRGGLRWPANAVTIATALAAIATIVPLVLGAFMAGSEQAQDTWKTILVRRPTRAPFIVAKVVSGLGVVVVTLSISGAIALGAFELTARIVDAPINLDYVARTAVDPLFRAIVMAPVSFALGFSAALLARTSAMAIGIIVGIVAIGLSAQLGGIDAWFSPYFFSAVPLGACVLGDVGEGCGSGVVVVIAWVVVPLLVSTIVFSRRDQLSGIG